jgi:predicted nucleic acid-binding protein
MSGFLIDTNVLSEYNRPGGPDAGVKTWPETTARLLQYVSVITLAEIHMFSCARRDNIVFDVTPGKPPC